MDLLYVGDSNWDYYLVESLNCVWYEAKPDSGCSSGVFGSIKYFKTWLQGEIKRNSTAEGRITAKGFKVLNEKIQ